MLISNSFKDDFKNLKAEKKAKSTFTKKVKPDPASDIVKKSSLVRAKEQVDIGAIPREANKARLEGRAPSLTQTKQETGGTLENFMAAWDIKHPGYGTPTGGEGKAQSDVVRNAVRERVQALLDPQTGKIPEGQIAALKSLLKTAENKKTIVGPQDIDSMLGKDINPVDEAAAIGSGLVGAGAHTMAQVAGMPGQTLADEVANPGSPESNLIKGVSGIGGMVLAGPAGAASGVADMVGSAVEGNASQLIQDVGHTVLSLKDENADWGTKVAGGVNLALMAWGLVHGVKSGIDNITGADVVRQYANSIKSITPEQINEAIGNVKSKFGPDAAQVVGEVLSKATPEQIQQAVQKAQTLDLESTAKPIVPNTPESTTTPTAIPENPVKVEQPSTPAPETGSLKSQLDKLTAELEQKRKAHADVLAQHDAVESAGGDTMTLRERLLKSADEMRPLYEQKANLEDQITRNQTQEDLQNLHKVSDGRLNELLDMTKELLKTSQSEAESKSFKSQREAIQTEINKRGGSASETGVKEPWQMTYGEWAEKQLGVQMHEANTKPFNQEAFTKNLQSQEGPLTTEPFDQPIRLKGQFEGQETNAPKPPPQEPLPATPVSEPIKPEPPVETPPPSQDAPTAVTEPKTVQEKKAYEETKNQQLTGEFDPVKATGLANQIQSRHVLEGIIQEIPSAGGKPPKEWLQLGQDAVANGADYIGLAKQIEGGKQMSPLDVAILSEGNRLIMKDVNDAKIALDADPKNPNLKAALDGEVAKLQNYLEQIQVGKGQASDVFRALQIASDVNTGSYADVLQRAQKTKYYTAKDDAEIGRLVDEVAKRDAEIERLKANPQEFDAKSAMTRARNRKYDKTALKNNIEANWKRFEELKGTAGVGGSKKRGAASLITSEDLKVATEQLLIVKDIALDHARLHLGASLEDVVIHVKDFFKSKGFDIDRQAVVDAMAHTESRPRSDAQKQLEALKSDARKNSTSTQVKQQLDARNKAVEVESKAAKQKFIDERKGQSRIAKKQMDYNERTDLSDAIKKYKSDQKAQRDATKAEQQAWAKAERTKSRNDYADWWNLQEKQRRYNEASDLKEAKKQIADAEKQAWKTVKDAQKAYDAGERLKDGAEKDAYRQWWRDQAAIMDAQEALRMGSPVGKPKANRTVTDDQATIKKLRQMANIKSKIAQSEATLESLNAGGAKPKKATRTVDDEIADLQAQRMIADARVRHKLNQLDKSNLSRGTMGVVSAIRGGTLGADIGVLTRQALFINPINQPKAWGKAVSAAGKTIFSEENLAKWVKQNKTKRYSDGKLATRVRKEAKLSTTDALNSHEEIVFTNIIKRIPGIGEKLGGSLERAQTTFINEARIQLFDQAYEKGLNPEDLRTRARYINSVTGRGNWHTIPEQLGYVMTSPRYELSRWETLGEMLRNPVEALNNKGARENLKDIGITLASLAALYKSAELAGYKTTLDKDSPDFLKLRKGNQVWDVSAGLAPRLRDAFRAISSLGTIDKKDTWNDIGAKIAARTIAPHIRTPIEQTDIALQRSKRATSPKSIFSGFKVEGEITGWETLTPLIWQSFHQALNNKENLGEALGVAGKEFIGGGVNYYPPKSSKKKSSFGTSVKSSIGSSIKSSLSK